MLTDLGMEMPEGLDPWQAWLRQHGPALVLLARQRVPSQADAEDVVQEAFIRFWKSRERVTDPAGYLYATVRHCALDWQRGQQRRTRRELATAKPDVAAWFVAPSEQEERRRAVEAALARLPDEQREVLVLKIWGGLSFRQIATALEIPANTAASRYRYALARLREQLAEESIP